MMNSHYLILIIAFLMVIIYLVKSISGERKREKILLNEIKQKLLPTIIDNLKNICNLLEDRNELIKSKVKLANIFNENLSIALYVDFKEHFYKLGLKLRDFKESLIKFDELISKNNIEEAVKLIYSLKNECKILINKLEEIKEVKKLPPRKYGFK